MLEHGHGNLPHVALGVRTTVNGMDCSSIDVHLSLALPVYIRCCIARSVIGIVGIGIVAHIGTRIGRVCVDGILAVATAKHLVNLECAVDRHRCGRRRGCITTAIHALYARQSTSVDNDLGGAVGQVGRDICRLIATSVDGSKVVVALFLLCYLRLAGVLGLIDVNQNRAERRSVEVVASEDASAHHASFHSSVGNILVQAHRYVAADRRLMCAVAHSTTVDVAFHGTSSEVHGSGLARVGVGISQRTAAIDILLDGAPLYIDLHIAAYRRHLTAAKHSYVAANGGRALDVEHGICHLPERAQVLGSIYIVVAVGLGERI